MADLFSTAQLFLSTQEKTPERMLLIQELKTLLKNSEFISEGEKKRMEQVIPLFTDAVIKDLQKTLIRQNLRHLQRKMAETK
jgi:hypothetical protein